MEAASNEKLSKGLSRMARNKPVKPAKREDLTRKAYLGIRRMLFHNEIIPGQKLSYRDLAERMGMSQTPVIQALKWLEFQQLVRREPHRGYYTEPVSLQEVEEAYELRQLIEVSLLEKTARRLAPDGLKQLEKALQSHLEASREVYLSERLLRDRDFHLTLAGLSGCRVQVRTLNHLFDLLYMKYGGSILFSTSMQKADAYHRAIYERIAAGDFEKASATLAEHISGVRRHVLSGLEKMIAEKKITAV